MSDMAELRTFVRRCLDEREMAARDVLALEADGFEWEYQWARLGRYNGRVTRTTHEPGAPSPREMLSEVEAKRSILDRWETATWEERAALSWVVEQLAQPYAGREGWREEWRVAARPVVVPPGRPAQLGHRGDR